MVPCSIRLGTMGPKQTTGPKQWTRTRTSDEKAARTRLHRLQEPLRLRRQQAAVRTRRTIRRRAGMAAAYMDARRYANAQGLTMKGPRRIYDAFHSSAGMLFAQRHGLFRPYHDTVFRRFWSHDLEIDELSDIAGVIASVGGSARDLETYVHGPARAEHDRIIDEAEALGVFGVPTMVFNGELFWGGDRIDLLIERIKNPESIAMALGSRHRK